MNQSMPRFENKDSLERFIGNMKLQIFNAEFATLCKVSTDSMRQLFDDSNDQFEKDNKKTHQSPKINIPRTREQLLQIVNPLNPRSVLTKRRKSDVDLEKEISLQSDLKIKKQETNQFNQKPPQDLSITAPMPGMYSEEAKINLQQSPKQGLLPESEQNSQEKKTFDMKLEDCENNENSNNNQMALPLQQNQPAPVQNLDGGATGRMKFIQPIYVVFPNQTYGYVEVDVMDENAMKNVSLFIQQQQQQYPQPQ
jgi:hypothetical protein